MPPFILVDGSSYLYRAYHSLPPLSNASGEPTGAIYGVLNMLRRLRNDYQPEQMVVVFDAPGKTFRDELYPDYKAQRPPMPDELREQIEPLLEIIQALGYPLLSIAGVEADDVIATLATQAAAQDFEVIIASNDKDLAQLVNANIRLLNTMNDSSLDEAGVIKKFGVKPEQIIDYLTLIGDSVDNIPGVDKVGPKTAAKWLQEYGSLANLLEQRDTIKGKIGDNLRAAVDRLPLSKQLITLDCAVPLDRPITDWHIAAQNIAALKQWFQRFEFNSWLTELNQADNTAQPTPNTAAEPQAQYETILTQQQLDNWLDQLKQAPLFAFDTETSSLNYIDAEIIGVSFATDAGKAAYVPLAHRYPGVPEQLARDTVLAQLKPLLAAEQRQVVGQHIKYDRNVLANYGIELTNIGHDTMLESYTLNSTASRHDMDSLAKKYLGLDTVHYEDIAGKGAKQIPFAEIDIDTASHYAAEDADITLRLHQHLWPKLAAEPGLAKIYAEIEQPLIPVLSRMECRGVLVDGELLQHLSAQFADQMQLLVDQAHKLADSPFNMESPKQIQQILFEQQGLPIIRKTPKGQPSTAEDVLQELADQGHELPRLIVEYRTLSKLKSTYTDKLLLQINATTGRVHTSYHQAVASTGRLSSANPNLQNIPIRTADGRKIRQAFIAGDGNKLLAADYSQIELRIMAHLSGDSSLIQAFSEGRDIHRATAAEVFGLAADAVSAEQRRAAKAINFGLIYGMSAFGLAKQLNISRGEAQAYVDLYFDRYPGVKTYMDNIREQAREQGYVETVFGRRLYLPEIQSRNAQRRQYAERTAINAPMQGTAADIIKRAMLSVDAWLETQHPKTWLIMQVHDELVFELPADNIDQIQAGIKQRMIAAAELSVPLEVDIGVGDNWEEAH